MITRFITDVRAVFNPFSPRSKTARLFLSFFPANARQDIRIDTKMLQRSSEERSFVHLKFSTFFGYDIFEKVARSLTVFNVDAN
jgi:large subunit ribosomal protein L53